jgi:hypothetical protein
MKRNKRLPGGKSPQENCAAYSTHALDLEIVGPGIFSAPWIFWFARFFRGFGER